MSHKTELLPRMDGESLTDWTLRFLADGRQQLRVVQEVRQAVMSVPNCPHPHDCLCEECERESYNYRRRTREAMDDRRRMDDLYRACTPVESEYAEGGEE